MTDTNSVPVIGAKKPIEERVQLFNVDLEALLGKHELAIGVEPFIEQGLIKGRIVVGDRVAPAEGVEGGEKLAGGAEA